MMRYVFREPPITIKNAKSADPQKIGEALNAIAVEHGGRLTPVATVDAARDRRHVLHPHFEWRDRVAAEAHRLDQARALIRVVRVIDDEQEDPQPHIAFLSVNEGRNGHSYFSQSAVAASMQLQILVLTQAERDLAAWERRYSELTDICEAVRELRGRIRSRLPGGDDDHPPPPS